MADCSRLLKCAFFNDRMADMPASAEIYKKNYCKSEFDKCARFRVAAKLGPEKVPSDLFPNQKERADQLTA